MKFEDVENGVMLYINKEFCRRIEDWRKWGIPLALGFYMPSLKKKFVDNISILKSAGIVTDNDDIVIDAVYQNLSKIAKDNGTIKCDIPMLGSVTFSDVDVDSLYNILKQNSGVVNPSSAVVNPYPVN